MESETINTIADSGSQIGEFLVARGGSYAAGLEMMIVSLATVLIISLSILFFLTKKNKRELEQTQELCTCLRNDLQIAASCAIGMGQRIISLEKKINGQVDFAGESQSLSSSLALEAKAAQAKTNKNHLSETFKKHDIDQKISPPKLKAVQIDDAGRQSHLNSFDKASELLKSGMSEDEVAKRCELSSSETALMAMVMKQKSANG